MMRIHLDTDIGGDVDDVCALALLLRWPDVEITGITTVAEAEGRRAGYARYLLKLAGREEIPVAAGADVSLGRFRELPGYPDEARFWPEPVPAMPGPLEAALQLLKASVDSGAVIVGIGPFTNLALLEERFPGTLARARIVLMGGYVRPIRPGFPNWPPTHDYNVQQDAPAAQRVCETAQPVLVPITVTAETAFRRAYLPGLERAGPLGALIARQGKEYDADYQNEARYGATCSGLPGDILNFQHDPLAVAVALGWAGTASRSKPCRWCCVSKTAGCERRSDPRGGRLPSSLPSKASASTTCGTSCSAVEDLFRHQPQRTSPSCLISLSCQRGTIMGCYVRMGLQRVASPLPAGLSRL